MPVGKLNPFNPVEDDFESWVGVMNNYLLANDINKADKDKGGAAKAVAVFLSSVGVSTYSLLHDLMAPDKPETKGLDALVKELMDHYKPAPKALAERHKFYSRKQRHGESVNLFLVELRKSAVTCKFGDLDTSLRDQFILGLQSETAQKRIFVEADDVKLAKVVSIAVSTEQAEASTLAVRGGTSGSFFNGFDTVLKVHPGKGGGGKRNQKPVSSSSCPNCGGSHSKTDCPHKNIECHKCHKKGHFARFCRGSSNSSSSTTNNGSNSSSARNRRNNQVVHGVKNVRKSQPPILIHVQLNGSKLAMELDTGSDSTFISKDEWKFVGSPKLVKPSKFSTFTDEVFTSLGQFNAKLNHNGQSRDLKVEVSDRYSILGRDFLNSFQVDWNAVKSQCNQVKLTKKSSRTEFPSSSNEVPVEVPVSHTRNPSSSTSKSKPSQSAQLQLLLDEFSDVFDKPVGVISDFKARLLLKEDATPRFCKARPVPFAIRPKVDFELEKMEKSGAITRIEHSDWASALVVVPKPNGKVRITGDFKRTVNAQLCVSQYPLARSEDLFESIAGGNKFSKLDGPDAYHQVEIDESSKKFLVINTHRGLYRYNVLPQGIASSPAIFQELMDKMLQGIPKTGAYIDDVVTSGKDDSAHLKNLREIFTRMRKCNFRLSREKCLFLSESIPFLGHMVSSDGIRPHPKNVEAIVTMPKPKTTSEVQSFLGLVNFYAKFIPNLSSVCESLYRLTRANVQFQWSEECENAFVFIKRSVTSAPVLAHFHQAQRIGIACDASSVGLGVVLFHKYEDGSELPIAFASKTLSSSERNYSQIEKEGLAIIFGIKRFHQFLYGRRFLLVTDHQPLITLFGEKTDLPPLVATRLHRWSLFLSAFSFEIIYRNTSKHGNADALSRLPLNVSSPEDLKSDLMVKRLHEENPVTSKVVKFRSSRDPVLSKVFRYVRSGWPSHQNQLQKEIQPFFSHRHAYTVEDGTLMWGVRVVIPASLTKSILSQLHDTHPGVVRMKAIARQHVWWPGIDKDIESTVKNCAKCCVYRDNPSAAPVHPWVYPEKPWQRLHIDLAGPFIGNMWLVIMDAHSKWPEVFKLGNNSTSSRVIECVRETFSRFGIPNTIVSDNGTQFVSEEFRAFCISNGIRHTTSSVYHPRSNGEAERFIRTFKMSMKKGKGDNCSLCCFLLTYRVTPHAMTGVSPSELLLKRHPKTLLDLIKPDPGARVRQQQELMVECDKRITREFQPGQKVWVQSFSKNDPKWSPGKVVRALGPLSYEVQVGDRKMKRHVDHIISSDVSVFPSELSPAAAVVKTPVKTPVVSPKREPDASPEFRSASSSPATVASPVHQVPVPVPFELHEDSYHNSSLSSRPTRNRKKPERLNYSSFN